MIGIFCVVVTGNGFNVILGREDVDPIVVVVDTVFRTVEVVGINLVVVVGFGVDTCTIGGFITDLAVVLDEPTVESPLTVVTFIVVAVGVVVGAELPIFPVVVTILIVVIIFCVEIVGEVTVVGFGRKVVVGFRFFFPFLFSGHGTVAVEQLCSTNNSEIPIKMTLNIS